MFLDSRLGEQQKAANRGLTAISGIMDVLYMFLRKLNVKIASPKFRRSIKSIQGRVPL
jgi:hypothetical protein